MIILAYGVILVYAIPLPVLFLEVSVTSTTHSSTYDLLCIGNAIVDMLAEVTSEQLASFGAVPGGMTLIDAESMTHIQNHIHIKQVAGGGSAANTAVVSALAGLKTAYLGKVADDEAGREFAQDLQRLGIMFPSTPLKKEGGSPPTARCLVMVTPDGQRTMFTFLGACVDFTPHDVVEDIVNQSAITYLEGYLFDKPEAQKAFYRAAEYVDRAGRKLALSLSDVFCIQRHHTAFRDLVAHKVDILFANEAEICALYGVTDLNEALKNVALETSLAVVTRGEKGAAVIAEGKRVDVPAGRIDVVDTTGAGDAFAAGFLAGYRRGHGFEQSVALGNMAAGEVITRLGARPGPEFSLPL